MKNIVLIVLLLFYKVVFSQCEVIEHNFGAKPNFNSGVNCFELQSDNKILVGGDFTYYNFTEQNHILRLNVDGSIDTTFNINKGFDGSIKTIKVQSDGKILVGGSFIKFNGLQVSFLVRLNTDGSLDSSFNLGYDLIYNWVNALNIQPDGKILVSGDGKFFRLNSDGSIDNSFIISSSSTAEKDILLQSDGKIIIIRTTIVRLNSDGSNDTSFAGNSFQYAKSIALQTDGKIVAVGSYLKKIIRLNSDGTLDTNFNIVGSGFNRTANKVLVQSDGKILVGGDFLTFSSTIKKHLARLNSDGSIDNTFNIPLNTIIGPTNGLGNPIGEGVINDIIIQSDNKIIAGGTNITNNYVRLNTDGSIDNSNTGLDNTVECISLQSDNKILVGGSFISFNGISKNKINRFNSNGQIDNSFNIGSGFDGTVKTIALQPDNKILVGGDFTSFNGLPNSKIVRLNSDGSVDNTFVSGVGFDNSVNKILIQADGKIIVSGTFLFYNNIASMKLVRLNPNGTIDNTFNIGAGFNSAVKTIALQPDNKLLVGGNFTRYNNIVKKGTVRLNIDGSLDTSFNCVGDYSFTDVKIIVVQTDGNIIIVGSGEYLGKQIIRVNPFGTVITYADSYSSYLNGFNSIAVQSDGKIIAGGNSSNYPNWDSPQNLMRLNSNFTIDNSFGIINSGTASKVDYSTSPFFAPVKTILIQNDGKILVGGQFLYYNSNSFSSNLMRLYGNICPNIEPPIVNSTQALLEGSRIINLTPNERWFSSQTGGVQLDSFDTLTNNTTYYLQTITNNGCVSQRAPVLVKLFPVANLPSVTIGTQIWNNNNLDVSTYSDGTPIPQVSSPVEWANLHTGAWCYYNNDPTNDLGYGKLYNWYATAGIYNWESFINPILRKQLAPVGWHIPNQAEWNLISNIGNSNSLRETGINHWTSPNAGATNSSGFTALPGGRRWIDKNTGLCTYINIGNYGNWWADPIEHINLVNNFNNINLIYFLITQGNPLYANGSAEFANSGNVTSNEIVKKFGFSVRLLQNNTSSLSNNETNPMTNNDSKVNYFPNPVIDILNVQSSSEINYLKITNILGQAIFQNSFNSKFTQINTSDFPSGIYIVTLESEGKKETFKIIKK